jgi:hypothetical protein
MPFHPPKIKKNSIIHVMNLSLQIPSKRKFGLCKNISMPKSMRKKEKERKDVMPKKHEPKKKERKKMNRDSPHFQKFQNKRERGMTKEYQKLKKIYSTRLHNLNQSV